MDSCGWNVQHIDILQKTWSGQLDCTPGVVVLPRWPCAAGSEEFRTQDGYDTLMPIPPCEVQSACARGGGRPDPLAAHAPANEMIKQRAAEVFCRSAVR